MTTRPYSSTPIALAFLSMLALTAPATAQTEAPPANTPQVTVASYLYSWVTWFGGVVGWVDASINAEVSSLRDALVEDATVLEGLIDRAGFSLDEVRIGMGPIPTIALGIAYERDISAAERAELINHIKTSDAVGTIERILVYTLLDIADSKPATEGGLFSLKGLDIDVDLIPGITLILAKDEAGEEDTDKAPAPAAAPTTPVETEQKQGG